MGAAASQRETTVTPPVLLLLKRVQWCQWRCACFFLCCGPCPGRYLHPALNKRRRTPQEDSPGSKQKKEDTPRTSTSAKGRGIRHVFSGSGGPSKPWYGTVEHPA